MGRLEKLSEFVDGFEKKFMDSNSWIGGNLRRSVLVYPLKRLSEKDFLINLFQPFLSMGFVLNTLFLFICRFVCDVVLRLANTCKFLFYTLSGGPEVYCGDRFYTRWQYLKKAFFEPFKIVFNYFNLYALAGTVAFIGMTLFTVVTWPFIFAPRILTTVFWPTMASERLIDALDYVDKANNERLAKVSKQPIRLKALRLLLEKEAREKLSSNEEKLAYEFERWRCAKTDNGNDQIYINNFKKLIQQGVNIKVAQGLYEKVRAFLLKDFLHELLMIASIYGDKELAELLLKEGAQIDKTMIAIRDMWTENLIITVYHAVKHKQIEFLKWLINDKNIPPDVITGESVNLGTIWVSDSPSDSRVQVEDVVTSKHISLMFHAFDFLDIEFVELLLEKDIDLFAKDLYAECFPYHPLDVLVGRYNEALRYEKLTSKAREIVDKDKKQAKQKPMDPKEVKQTVHTIFELIVNHVLAKNELKTQKKNLDRMLHCAASIGHLEKVKELVEEGADVNATGLDCTAARGPEDNIISFVPAIYIACARGHKEVVNYLLKQKAIDVNKVASWCNFADPKAERDTGIRGTLLHVACDSLDAELVNTLLNDDRFKEKIVDSLQCPNDLARLPLLSSMNGVEAWLSVSGFIDISNDSEIDSEIKQSIFIFNMLVKAYAKHNLLDYSVPYSLTAIEHACVFGNIGAVRMLLDNGADPQQIDKKTGRTLFHLVAAHQYNPTQRAEIIKVLAEYGADIHATVNDKKLGSENSTALHIACIESVVDYEEDGSPKTIGANENNLEIVKALIEAGAEVNAANGDGKTVLLDACSRGEFAVVGYLLECGANVLAVDRQFVAARWRRPLDAALDKWDLGVIQYWLDNLDTLYAAGEDQKQEDLDQQKQNDLDMVLRTAKSKGDVEKGLKDLMERLEKAGAKSDKVQEKVEKAPEDVLKPPVGNEFRAGQGYGNNNL